MLSFSFHHHATTSARHILIFIHNFILCFFTLLAKSSKYVHVYISTYFSISSIILTFLVCNYLHSTRRLGDDTNYHNTIKIKTKDVALILYVMQVMCMYCNADRSMQKAHSYGTNLVCFTYQVGRNKNFN